MEEYKIILLENQKGLKMNKIPSLNDLVISSGFDQRNNNYVVYKVISLIKDEEDNKTIYVLKGISGGYILLTENDFELEYADYKIFDIENKKIITTKNDKGCNNIYFNVFDNFYQISVSNKASKKVEEDLINELNKKVSMIFLFF